MVRPLVLLFQEFAERTAVPITPDLNTVLIGPAYQIYDFPDDKALIEVSPYGRLHADNPYQSPVANAPALTLAAPPGAAPGSWVEPSSVRVFLDDARVIMAQGTDGETVDTAPNENTLSSDTATFVTQGVQAGDTLIIDNPDGAKTPNVVLTVMSVESETVIRVSSNFAAAATNLGYRIERRVSNQEVPSAYIRTPTYKESNEIQLLGGIRLPVGNNTRLVTYGRVYVSYRALRTDLQNLDSVSTTNEILAKVGRIDARNTLAAALLVARQNAGQAPIYFYGVPSDDAVGFNQARDAIANDETVYAIVLLTSDLSIIASYKMENEQLADPTLALNQGIPQKFRVVLGSGTLRTRQEITDPLGIAGTAEQVAGAQAPGLRTLEISTLDAFGNKLRPGDKITLSANNNPVSLAGTYTIAHINSGTVVELDEILPISVTSPEGINYTVTRPSTGETIVPLADNRVRITQNGVTYYSRVAGSLGRSRSLVFEQEDGTPDGVHAVEEDPGATTTIRADFDSGAVTAQKIVNAIRGIGVTQGFSGSVNFVATTDAPTTAQTAGTINLSGSTDGGEDVLIGARELDESYTQLYSEEGAFLTEGVQPGDLIEVPLDTNAPFGATPRRYVVDRVLSEQRLQIQNVSAGVYQSNTANKEHELPHFDDRQGTGSDAGTNFTFRVTRELSKDQQVAQLVSVSQSFNSRRAVLTWPDKVWVAGLVDNSKPKNADGTPALADAQPGFYMSAVVGGMTAGLPSQQGFSRLGIAGISRIEHSNDYFSERQLTDLSDGGWYVFAQNSPTSLPFCIHQLTTDPSALESGEFSIVKNFDFVALFFLSILEPFLGVWNINNDTLGFVRQAMNTGIEQLKLRRVAKIGAPINDAALTGVEISKASSDRIEVYFEVDLPKPLNVMGLHLVA